MKGDVIVRELGRRERDAFVDVVATAFAQDPLFTDVLGRVDHARALVRYLFGANRVLGGNRLGLFVEGRMARAALLEPPEESTDRGAPGWQQHRSYRWRCASRSAPRRR